MSEILLISLNKANCCIASVGHCSRRNLPCNGNCVCVSVFSSVAQTRECGAANISTELLVFEVC
jgi:hypothetical protein